MVTILIYVLILWAVIALAWLVAWWLKRRGATSPGDFTSIVLFVGFLFGFLLTTLQVFATNHYSTARSEAQSEPTSLVAMYDDLGTFPAHVRATGHRAIICYMWSVAEGDWKAQERGDLQESSAALAWGDRLRNFRNSLPPGTPATSQVSTDLSNADNARQQLMFLAQPQIPAILWVTIFLGAGLLLFFQICDSQSQRKTTRRVILVALTALITIEVASLGILDRPFSPVARIHPSAMTDAIALLEAGRPGLPTAHDCGRPATTTSYRPPSGRLP
jgi:flagellar basal body-associated protein FliL